MSSHIPCEACRRAPAEETVTQYTDAPFHLCGGCAHRVQTYSLRPLEWFNLAAKYGIDEFLLHDDFYEEDGAAMQPQEEVIEAELFPAPTLDEVRSDLARLIDYAFTRWRLEPSVVEAVADHPPGEVLAALRSRFAATESIFIQSAVFQLCAEALGRRAEPFIRERFETGEPYSHDFVSALAKCLPAEESFPIAVELLAALAPKDLPRAGCSLAEFQTEQALDWIERQIARPDAVVTEAWGRLAAMSHLSWARVERWLDQGRPLSLVALDALNACWHYDTPQLRERRPKLQDPAAPDVVQLRLNQYAEQDNVPRVTRAVAAIVSHFEEIRRKS